MLTALLDEIAAKRLSDGRVVVGISGFGGSGKSTLARELVSIVDGSVRIRGDDFLDPHKSHERSTDWAGVERARLRAEVLDPFHDGVSSEYRRWDWERWELAPAVPVPESDVLIVDFIGLFHPDALDALDLTVWVDVDLATATERGKARDRGHGHDHDRLWDEVWVPNETDFASRFFPRAAADIRYVADRWPGA